MLRSAVSVLAMLTGSAALAEGPRALVIGVPDGGAPMAFADSYNVTQALRRAGMTDITLLRDTTVAEISATWDAVDPEILYLSGPFPTALRARLQGDDRPGILLLDDCAAPLDVSGPGVARASDAGFCDTGGLAARIAGAQPGDIARDFNGVLQAAWTGGAPEAFTIDPPEAGAGTDFAVQTGGVVSIAPVSPVAAASGGAIAGTAISGTIPEGAEGDENVALFLANATAALAAIPTPPGFPEPSIVLGILEPTPAAFTPEEAEEEDAEVADAAPSVDFGYQDVAARTALRDSDPDTYVALVRGGAFDPPDVELASALQTELARMGCYRVGIDGIWGNGSRGSVERYFEEVEGQTAETLEPTIGLFRQIISNADVECPEPVAAPAPSRSVATTTRSTTQSAPARAQTRSAPVRQQQAAPRRAAPAPAAPAPSRTLRRGNLGSGVFR